MAVTVTHNGASIQIEGRTARARLRLSRYSRALGLHVTDDEEFADLASYAIFYLSHIVSIEGDLGFVVPIGSADADALRAFADGFLSADEVLMNKLDDAILLSSKATNDANLLPPEEVDAKN